MGDTAASAAPQPASAVPGDHMKDGWGVPSSARVATLRGPFTLDSGAVLPEVTLAYNTYGTLAPGGDNAVVVGHSLTSNSCVHEWWPQLLGDGPAYALDTSRYFVVCVNYLGSVYGSASPLTRNPATGERYAAGFPIPSIRDNVRLQRALLAELGVTRVALAVGGSLGGMLALEWAATFPALVEQLVVVAAPPAHAGWAIGINEVGRQAVYADPRWQGGWYDLADPPVGGMAVARQLAMVTYRSPASFDAKFGRALRPGAPPIAVPTPAALPASASCGSLSSMGSGGAPLPALSTPTALRGTAAGGPLHSPTYAVAEGSPMPVGLGGSGGGGGGGAGGGPREAFSLGESALPGTQLPAAAVVGDASALPPAALPSPRPPPGAATGMPRSQFEVEAYLRYQGDKFVRRFDPLCYVRLTQTLDTHNVGAHRAAPAAPLVGEGDGPMAACLRTPGAGGGGSNAPSALADAVRGALAALPQRTLVVGIDSDLLYPLDLQKQMADAIPRSNLFVISSPHGHDSFLIEIAQLNSSIVEWLRQGRGEA